MCHCAVSQVDVSPACQEELQSGPGFFPPAHHWSWYVLLHIMYCTICVLTNAFKPLCMDI